MTEQRQRGGTEHIDVRYVAHLARLHVTNAEAALYQAQLDDILAYAAELQELDVSDVEPTAHAMPVQNVFRDDVPAPAQPLDDTLNNAPESRGGLFAVPRIIE